MQVVQLKDEITADSKTQSSGSYECRDRGGVRPDQDLRGENGSADECGNRCCGDGVRTFQSREQSFDRW